MALTDQDLVKEIQYTLMELPIDGASFPSALWTTAEVAHRLNERQNRLLKGTQLLLSSAVLPVKAHEYRIALPADWLLTQTIVWRGANGRMVELNRSDSFETDHGLPRWSTDFDEPVVYMDFEAPSLQVQIAPAPNMAGTLLLLYVAQGATLGTDLLNAPERIGVPDEFAAALKYGTLADLFGKDGRGKSPERAQYCEHRYAMAGEIADIILNGWV